MSTDSTLRCRLFVFYVVTISEEDHPAGGTFEDVHAALSYAEEVSRQAGRWDGVDVHVWEASDGDLGPTLDRLMARFVDGKRVNLG